MPTLIVSTKQLRKDMETKAYAYGVSPAVAGLLGDYIVEYLRELQKQQWAAIQPSNS